MRLHLEYSFSSRVIQGFVQAPTSSGPRFESHEGHFYKLAFIAMRIKSGHCCQLSNKELS